MEKVNFNKGVKIIISPTENGYACGMLNDTEKVDIEDEGLYLCHVIAQGMIKFAMSSQQEASDFGVQQISEHKETPLNGDLKRFDEYDNVVDLINFKKNKKDLH